MKKRGIIGTPSKVFKHPETGKECKYYVEYQEDGQHVDSATFVTKKECQDWLTLLYNVEAGDGTV